MLCIQPISFREANAFIARHHRHHKPSKFWKFGTSVVLASTSQVVGVIMVGRPLSRYLDNGHTLEVTRCCTDGTPNAASMLYAAAWRATRALGYSRLITYTLPEEPGTSLRAAGWLYVRQSKGGSWNHPGRPRVDKAPTGPKSLWEIHSNA
jgi:hypothetical protein